MTSHVVVIDSTARRTTVQTTPTKHLAEVLQEACAKLGLNAAQHGLKHRGKQLDLSLSFRLSGLSSGAKLELVQLSRSPSIVTVALQLLATGAQGVPNERLVDKFPSSTTLWLILRKFEAGVAGNGVTRNLTARGVPARGDTGSGRLFYEIPVIHVLGRELSTFTDLQKTLAQLGFNSGNILLRLSFRMTEEPLKEAMVKIDQYFKSLGDDMQDVPKPPPSAPAQEEYTGAIELAQSPVIPQTEAAAESTSAIDTTAYAPPTQFPDISSVVSRPVTVYSPPSASTPLSSQTDYREDDYVPSIEQAKAHQRRLNQASRPRRLPTDAEIAAKAAAEQGRLAAIQEVDVKVRFPDQSQVVAKFGQRDTGQNLYEFVRSCITEQLSPEKFVIIYTPSVGAPVFGTQKIPSVVVPDSDSAFLIRDLGMVGRVLVSFSWDADASPSVRESRADVLKPELRSAAQQLKIAEISGFVDESEARPGTVSGAGVGGKNEEKGPGDRKGGNIPKWLKLPGKK